MKGILVLLAGIMAVVVGCSTMTVSEEEQKRSDLDTMAEATIASLAEQSPEIQGEIDDSVGYAVANMKLTKVPLVGAGGGEGVLIVNDTQQHIYFTVKRMDVGGGWGVRSYKVLMVIDSQDILDKLQGGTWEFQAGAEVSAGSASAEGSSSDLGKGFTLHVLSDGGASATVTARVIRIKVNKKLTQNP